MLKCFDYKIGEYVALKIVRNEKRFHDQALEEIRILEYLNNQEKQDSLNCLTMFESFTFRNHICLTFELLSKSLFQLNKKNNYNGFSIQLVKKFTHSILKFLHLLNKNKIIHCDLKPENILLKQPGRSGIKVIDYGLCCFEQERIYTYIQSRFYRAPEVILGAQYGMPIDMWSLGCIIVELLTGYPLFPGEDEADQLACIIELLGMPPPKILQESERTRNFFSLKGYPRYCSLVTYPNGTHTLHPGFSKRGKVRGLPGSKSWSNILNGFDDPLFLDFITRCLDWDPETRMTPAQALRHPWLTQEILKTKSENMSFMNRITPENNQMIPPNINLNTSPQTIDNPVQYRYSSFNSLGVEANGTSNLKQTLRKKGSLQQLAPVFSSGSRKLIEASWNKSLLFLFFYLFIFFFIFIDCLTLIYYTVYMNIEQLKNKSQLIEVRN